MKRGGKERGRRIDGLLREVIGERVAQLNDPRLRGVTIVEVRASKDTAVADVFVQLRGSEAAQACALDGLEAARPTSLRSYAPTRGSWWPATSRRTAMRSAR